MEDNLIAATEYGLITGLEREGYSLFRNVPYAAPPFEDRRFRPPAPPERWDGVRDGTIAGPAAPQPSDDASRAEHYMSAPHWGEDCLTLEISTPDRSGSLPVMVWIHGGGFLFGAGSVPINSGHTFARDGIVQVVINYRLGVEGFLPLGEDADNLGLRDQVAALEWVQRNIRAFGGDPDNVTIFGQSAGAISVMMLLAMPSARGLFHRAISESGSPVAAVPLTEAEKATRRMAKQLRVPPIREGFASVPMQRLIDESLTFGLGFVKNPIRNGAAAFMLTPFRPVSGTPSLPLPPLEAAQRDQGVPLVAGTTRNECYDFIRDLLDPGAVAVRIFAAFGRQLMGGRGKVARAYRHGQRKLVGGVPLFEAVWTDWAFRIPTIRLAEARHATSYLYEFHWESPTLPKGLGSVHALEIPFMRDDLATATQLGNWGPTLLGSDPPQELAERMHSAWVSFAKTGSPGWSRYETVGRATMIFDTQSTLATDPAGIERMAWAGRR